MMINGKLVLVSGASSGIGAATAKAMAKARGRVVLLARRKEALDQVAAEITSASGQAWTYSVDLADADAVAAVAKQITEELGTPDIIINNEGAGRWLFVDETSPTGGTPVFRGTRVPFHMSRDGLNQLATKSDIAELKTDLIKWMAGLIIGSVVAMTGIFAALARLMIPD